MNLNFFKKQPTLKFKCHTGAYNLGAQIVEARRVIPYWVKKQAINKDVKFAKCPGMFDHAQMGYIIPAWCDIHIKANKQGIIIKTDMPEKLAVQPMDYSVVDGLAPLKSSSVKKVMKIPSPWSIFAKKGYSAFVLPATMHSPFLDKLYVYPGVVDYDEFSTVNFIFLALEECDFTIWAGTPLLQVIPFKRESMTAEVGKSTEHEIDLQTHRFYTRIPGAYRKLFHKKKQFTIKSV